MRYANPAFIPRNDRVEEALTAAVDHLETLVGILSRPFETSRSLLSPNLRQQVKAAIRRSAAPE
jgi:hypothetical protein